jgi:hypothetical protein
MDNGVALMKFEQVGGRLRRAFTGNFLKRQKQIFGFSLPPSKFNQHFYLLTLIIIFHMSLTPIKPINHPLGAYSYLPDYFTRSLTQQCVVASGANSCARENYGQSDFGTPGCRMKVSSVKN